MNTDTNDQSGTADATAIKPAAQPRKRRMARDPKANNEPTGKPVPSATEKVIARKRGPSKIAAVITLLEREQGATLAEMVEATGWLPHTTRATLTGLKKKGHTITKDKRDDVTCYRIAKAA